MEQHPDPSAACCESAVPVGGENQLQPQTPGVSADSSTSRCESTTAKSEKQLQRQTSPESADSSTSSCESTTAQSEKQLQRQTSPESADSSTSSCESTTAQSERQLQRQTSLDSADSSTSGCESTTSQSERQVQTQTPSESADASVSGCESTAEAETQNELRMLVIWLTVKLLTKCHTHKDHNQEKQLAHIKSLVNRTMEGLGITEGFAPDVKSRKKLSRAVMKDLRRKFSGKNMLETVILLEDPVVDEEIAKCMRLHIRELSAQLAAKDTSFCWWKEALRAAAYTVGLLGAFALILFLA